MFIPCFYYDTFRIENLQEQLKFMRFSLSAHFSKSRWSKEEEEEVKILPQCAFNLIPISVEKFIIVRVYVFHYDYKKRFKVTLHNFNVSKLPKCCCIRCYALLKWWQNLWFFMFSHVRWNMEMQLIYVFIKCLTENF